MLLPPLLLEKLRKKLLYKQNSPPAAVGSSF
jgi:hypothetical protein